MARRMSVCTVDAAPASLLAAAPVAEAASDDDDDEADEEDADEPFAAAAATASAEAPAQLSAAANSAALLPQRNAPFLSAARVAELEAALQPMTTSCYSDERPRGRSRFQLTALLGAHASLQGQLPAAQCAASDLAPSTDLLYAHVLAHCFSFCCMRALARVCVSPLAIRGAAVHGTARLPPPLQWSETTTKWSS